MLIAQNARVRTRNDLFKQPSEIFDCSGHPLGCEQIRIVLGAPEQSVRAIAEFNIEIKARATAFDIHVRHAPARRQWSDIGRER